MDKPLAVIASEVRQLQGIIWNYDESLTNCLLCDWNFDTPYWTARAWRSVSSDWKIIWNHVNECHPEYLVMLAISNV